MKEIVKNKQSFLDVIVNSGTKQTAEQNETKVYYITFNNL